MHGPNAFWSNGDEHAPIQAQACSAASWASLEFQRQKSVGPACASAKGPGRPCIDVAQGLEVRGMEQIDAGRNEREECRAGQKEDPRRHDRAPTSPGGYAEESSHSIRSVSAERPRTLPHPRALRGERGKDSEE